MKKLLKCNEGEPGAWKVPEAAAYARCGERSIRKGIAAGIIPHLKFGRNIVIPKSAFLRWLDSAGETTK